MSERIFTPRPIFTQNLYSRKRWWHGWHKQPLSLPWFCVWLGKILILDVSLCISASTTTHPNVYCEKTLLKHSVKAQKNMEMEPFLIKLQERELERSCFGLTLTIFSGVTDLNKTCEGYCWLSHLIFLRLFWNFLIIFKFFKTYFKQFSRIWCGKLYFLWTLFVRTILKTQKLCLLDIKFISDTRSQDDLEKRIRLKVFYNFI